MLQINNQVSLILSQHTILSNAVLDRIFQHPKHNSSGFFAHLPLPSYRGAISTGSQLLLCTGQFGLGG
jgi:hypothetical protein